MEYARHIGRRASMGCLVALLGSLAWDAEAGAQIPGLPLPTAPAAAPARSEKEKPVATASGPIDVEKKVDDEAIRTTLQELLPDYPGVRRIAVTARDGVVTLDGHVDDDETHDEVTDFTRRVEGVRLVRNRTKTDDEVMTGRQLALKVLGEIRQLLAQKWLLVLIALGMFLIALTAARLFGGNAETLLAPFVSNVMLRSIVGSILSSAIVLGGAMAGLGVLRLTHAVLSIVGLAGVVTLAVGFAFKDIAENFIASLLLGVRRPFRIGDYIQVAGQSGVVKTLNTRATVLVTLEGNHVRIPNNVIYKEIMINSSASSSGRNSFDVLIPYEVSTAAALEAINGALCDQEGILADPPARALVEALESNGVRLRAYFWTPTAGVDGMKLASDLRMKVKVALQQAGIAPPPLGVMVSVAGRVPVEVAQSDARARHDLVFRPGAAVTREQAEANLRHDSRVAETASVAPANGHHQTALQHALDQEESHVSDEGDNLLEDGGRDSGN